MMQLHDRLSKKDWVVRDVCLEVAQYLVVKYHYAASGSNTRTYLHGLFKRGALFDAECLGVAWWIPPTKSAAQATYPPKWQGVLSLSRLVISPGVPKNACSFLIAQSRKLIDREKWPCLVTYADEWRGHTGGIYKADNWQYVGMTKPEAVYTINGHMIARKAGGKTRTHLEMQLMGAQLQGRFSKHKFVHIQGP